MRVTRYLLTILLLFAAGAAWGQKAQERYKAVPVQQQIDMCRSAVANGSANAIELCTTALNNRLTDDSRSLCYVYRAQAYERAGDTNSALEDLNGALGLASANNVAIVLGRRAALLFKTGNYSAAIQDNTALLRANPSDWAIWFNRGQSYYNLRNWDQAIQDYSRSIELNPNWAPTYTSRGLAYEQKGDNDRALQEYAAALQRSPNDSEALSGRERIEKWMKATLAPTGGSGTPRQPDDSAAESPAGIMAAPLFPIRELPPYPSKLPPTVSYIDSTGKVVLVLRTDVQQAGSFHEGMATIYGPKFLAGFIDRSGKVRVEPQYDAVRDFSEGLAAVNKGDKWGFVDSTGKLIIPMSKGAGDFSEGLAVWEPEDSKYGYIDRKGQMVIPPRFDGASGFSQGLACVQPHTLGGDGKWGYIDKTGKMVISARFQSCGKFSEGLAWVTINSLSGYIDKTGKVVVPLKSKEAYDFSGGLGLVCDAKCGFIDKAGKIVIALQYDSSSAIRTFSDGLASFCDTPSGKWGYIDKKGTVVIHPDYDGAGDFYEGLALVTFGGKQRYIDQTGNYVWPPTK